MGRIEGGHWLIIGGLLAGLAILTRVVGVTLIPGIVFFALLGTHRRLPRLRSAGRLATLLVMVFVLVAPWFARSITAEGPVGRGYFREFAHSKTVRAELKAGEEKSVKAGTPGSRSDAARPGAAPPAEPRELTRRLRQVVSRPMDNLWDFTKRLTSTPMPRRVEELGPGWTLAARSLFVGSCALLGGLAAAGLLGALLFRRAIHDGYLAAYCAVLLIWIGGGFRLVMPVLPFLFAYVYEGVVAATRLVARKLLPRASSLPEQLGITVLTFAILANLAITLYFPLINDRLSGRYEEWWSMYLHAVCRVGTVADPGDTVIAVPDNVPYYLVGLQAARLRNASGPEKMARNLLDSEAEFLVTTPMQRRRYRKNTIATAVKKSPEQFELVAGRFPVRAYRILPPGEEPDPNLRSPGAASPRCSELLPKGRP